MKILLNKLNAKTIGSAPSGLVSIPIKLSGHGNIPEEQSAVIAGIMGYKFQPNTIYKRPAVIIVF